RGRRLPLAQAGSGRIGRLVAPRTLRLAGSAAPRGRDRVVHDGGETAARAGARTAAQERPRVAPVAGVGRRPGGRDSDAGRLQPLEPGQGPLLGAAPDRAGRRRAGGARRPRGAAPSTARAPPGHPPSARRGRSRSAAWSGPACRPPPARAFFATAERAAARPAAWRSGAATAHRRGLRLPASPRAPAEVPASTDARRSARDGPRWRRNDQAWSAG